MATRTIPLQATVRTTKDKIMVKITSVIQATIYKGKSGEEKEAKLKGTN